VRDRRLWLSSLPVAALFTGLGVVSVRRHEPVFAASCFLAALVLVVPGPIAAVVNWAEALNGWKRKAAMAVLGLLALVLAGGMVTFFTVHNPPPGSP
jgi:hypothetical protein